MYTAENNLHICMTAAAAAVLHAILQRRAVWSVPVCEFNTAIARHDLTADGDINAAV